MTNQIINKNFKKWAYCEHVYGMTERAFKFRRLLPIMFLYFFPLIMCPVISMTSLPIDLIIAFGMSIIMISVFGFIYFLEEKRELDQQYRKRNNLPDTVNMTMALRISRSKRANLKGKGLSFSSTSELKTNVKRIEKRKERFYQLFLVLIGSILTTSGVLFDEAILADKVLIFIEIIKYGLILWGLKTIYFLILENDLNVLNELIQVLKNIKKKKR